MIRIVVAAYMLQGASASLFTTTFVPYHGYAGSLMQVGGYCYLFDTYSVYPNTIRFICDLENFDPRCTPCGHATECTVGSGQANACGVHIHEGTSCSTNANGHYFSRSSSPWLDVVYSGLWPVAGVDRTLRTGYAEAQLEGRTVIVHDWGGERIACAVLVAPPPPPSPPLPPLPPSPPPPAWPTQAANPTVHHVSPGVDVIAATVATASDGDVIMLSDGRYTASGGSALVTISKSITIQARSQGAAILDAEGMRRVVAVRGGRVTLSGLVVRGGRALRGAGIHVSDSYLIVSDVEMTHNQAAVSNATDGVVGRCGILVDGGCWGDGGCSQDGQWVCTEGAAVYVTGNTVAQFFGCHIHKNTDSGIHVHGGTVAIHDTEFGRGTLQVTDVVAQIWVPSCSVCLWIRRSHLWEYSQLKTKGAQVCRCNVLAFWTPPPPPSVPPAPPISPPPSVPPPSSPPSSPPPLTCLNTCVTANDAVCQDGWRGAYGAICEYGTDCADCGERVRIEPSSPPSAHTPSVPGGVEPGGVEPNRTHNGTQDGIGTPVIVVGVVGGVVGVFAMSALVAALVRWKCARKRSEPSPWYGVWLPSACSSHPPPPPPESEVVTVSHHVHPTTFK